MERGEAMHDPDEWIEGSSFTYGQVVSSRLDSLAEASGANDSIEIHLVNHEDDEDEDGDEDEDDEDDVVVVVDQMERTQSENQAQCSSSQEQPIHSASISVEEDEQMPGSERLVVVVAHGKRLGLAMYRASTAELSCGEFAGVMDQAADVLPLKMVLAEAEPTMLVTNRAVSEQAVKTVLGERAEQCSVITRAAGEFDAAVAESRMLQLSPACMPPELNELARRLEKLAFLMCRMDLYQRSLALRAIGCLIGVLLEKRIVNELEEQTAPIPISVLSAINHEQFMAVVEGTMAALQVFKSDAPPSIHGIGSRKEGLSLLGIVSGTKSTGGEQTLRRWMRYPSKDLALLEDRLDSVGFLKSPLHSHVIPQVQQSLRQVKDLNRILSRVTQFVGSLSDWDGLSQSLVSCLKVKQALMGLLWANDDDDNNEDLQQHQQPQQHQQGREAVPPLILKLLDLGSSKELLKLASIIYGTIDVEQSRRTARITVKQGVNETLDDLRYTYDGLDDFLHNLGLQQLQRYQREIAALKCVYYPQKGFAIAVPAGTDPGALERSLGFVHQFSTEQYHYFKNDSMRTVDRQLGDVYCEIVDLEKELLRQLAAFTARYSPAILEMYDLICQLDACIALSLAASHFNWVRPELLAQGHGCLQIDAGRHPLLEYCLTQSIPNDVSFDRERIKVVTGPNASGKSVFLKQVALIAFMAHIGSYVPASRARISVVDRLFTRISSRESVSVPQGTFMIDLCQVADILNHASSHSLVIMDEFGKGTHELDGQALLAATLRDLLHRHSPPPRVLVATHMDEVFRKQLISGSATAGLGPVGYYTMAYHIAKGFEDPVFLYKVIRGASLTSLATTVARLAGIPKDVADRAETILREKGNTPSLPELVCRHPSDQVLATFFNTRFDGEHALKIFAAQVRGLFGPACTPKKSSASSPKPSSSFPSSPHFSI